MYLIYNPINVRKGESLIHLFRIYGAALIELITEDYTLWNPQSILTTLQIQIAPLVNICFIRCCTKLSYCITLDFQWIMTKFKVLCLPGYCLSDFRYICSSSNGQHIWSVHNFPQKSYREIFIIAFTRSPQAIFLITFSIAAGRRQLKQLPHVMRNGLSCLHKRYYKRHKENYWPILSWCCGLTIDNYWLWFWSTLE